MKRDFALWTALLTGPIVWFISFEANFSLSWWMCASGWKPAAYGVSLVALAITAGAALLSWSRWRQLGNEIEQENSVDHGPGRPRAMAVGGVLLNAGFLIVLIAQALPHLLMNGCE